MDLWSSSNFLFERLQKGLEFRTFSCTWSHFAFTFTFHIRLPLYGICVLTALFFFLSVSPSVSRILVFNVWRRRMSLKPFPVACRHRTTLITVRYSCLFTLALTRTPTNMQKKASLCDSYSPHHFPTLYIDRHSNHEQSHKQQNLFHVYKEMLFRKRY